MTKEEALKKGSVSEKEINFLNERLDLALMKSDEKAYDTILFADDPEMETLGSFLSDSERRLHMHLMGKSGSGKSRLIESMVRQDIQRGIGLCLIDPHAELYFNVLRFIIKKCPKDIWDKVYLINPTAKEYLISFNPLHFKRGNPSTFAKKLIISIEKAWNEDFNNRPGIRECLYNTFKTSAIVGLSFQETEKLLYDEQTRINLVNRFDDYDSNPLKNSKLETFWKETINNPKHWKTILSAALNRFSILTESEPIAMMTLQGESIDLKEVVDSDSIILVNLSESPFFDSDSARTLGLTLINDILSTFLERSSATELSGDSKYNLQWNPFYLYIDEFHNYYTPDIKEILTGTRKFGLHLIMANQNFSQLDDVDSSARKSILNSAQIKAYFPTGDIDDSQDIMKQMGFYEPKIKESIKKYQELTAGYETYTSTSYTEGESYNARKSENQRAVKTVVEYDDNKYYTLEEVYLMEGKEFQLLPKRVFLFQSPEQPKGIFLKTDWVFNIDCSLKEILEFRKYVAEKHSSIYEKVSILKEKLKRSLYPKPTKNKKDPIIKKTKNKKQEEIVNTVNDDNPFA